ncbi:MAG: threonine synthase [Bacteroidales bacterium]|nr:threonine synthase [Bacteroidales bacterium]
MKYFSTQNNSPLAGFREAATRGQAPDKGLYFPCELPVLPKSLIENLSSLSKAEIAFQVISPYIGSEIPADALFRICEETVNFDFPLVDINDSISSLELFHGPTLAFKDVGARFMSRCLGYFSSGSDKKLTILVATSGDTGSAVANGFLDVENVNVVILYPSGKVSNIQELQLTTLGRNITALEVSGNFDDCQALVKQAFLDTELNSRLNLTSANSINVARWLPQQFYYFFALQQWKHEQMPVICVPSGNFGNICAGLIAHKTGMPALHFIAACNCNDVFTNYLQHGDYLPKPAVATYSNAMDVGDPSNFVRLLELFGHSVGNMREIISSCSVNDLQTTDTIREVEKNFNYLLEPHGAVAYKALKDYLDLHPGQKGIILETAHPIKFREVVEKATGKVVEIPESVKYLHGKEKQSIPINPDFQSFKDFLMEGKFS